MKVLLILLLLILLYLFLTLPEKPPLEGKTELLKHPFYAHRGLFDNEGETPENSLAAFRKAVEGGYGMELDLQLTKDDQLVVFHDDTLKRMCGVDGFVWDYTLEELQRFRLIASEETIPTFADALAQVNGQVPLIIEYKTGRGQTKICELGNRLLEKYRGVYCVESFDPRLVLWYRKHRPDVVRGQLSGNLWREGKPLWQNLAFLAITYLFTNLVARPHFIAYDHRYERNLSRRLCRKLGALSVTYTIKSREQYEKVKNQFELFIFDSCRL